MDLVNNTEVKRKRGRPPNPKSEVEEGPKRGRGRPRKYPVQEEITVKRGRGRPRKYHILEQEMGPNGELKPTYNKVDSGHLMKKLLDYFTKLMIVHQTLSKDCKEDHKEIFNRLKGLDFQMAEVCKKILAREYNQSELEENEAA